MGKWSKLLLAVAGVGALVVVGGFANRPARENAAAQIQLDLTGSRTVVERLNLPAASSVSLKDPDCDANALWFGKRLGDGAPDERRAAFTRVAATWSAECRATALDHLCEGLCDEVVSDMLLEATPKPERRALYKLRAERNGASLRRQKAMFSKVAAMVAYARSIRAAPRSSAYALPDRTREQVAADIFNGNPCIERMRADFIKVDALKNDIKSTLPRLDEGQGTLLEALFAAQSCIDCSDDRRQCDQMAEPMSRMAEDIADEEKLVTADLARAK